MVEQADSPRPASTSKSAAVRGAELLGRAFDIIGEQVHTAMHNNKRIHQDGFEQVNALKMAKQRTIVLKDKKTPGRKRMSDKTATKEPVNEMAAPPLPAASMAVPLAAATPPPAAAAPKV